jgi:hypothetical protein
MPDEEKTKRGRPRVFPEVAMRVMRDGEEWTDRTCQNGIYRGHAYNVLKARADEFPWLLARDGRLRRTVLTELGRLRDDDLILEAADAVEALAFREQGQLTVVDAVAVLRELRLSPEPYGSFKRAQRGIPA